MASKSWKEECIINTDFKKTQGSYFLTKISAHIKNCNNPQKTLLSQKSHAENGV